MLVRLNPNKDVTTVLSIPRDLKVQIPGHGVGKFNESYSYGGPKLVVQTIKETPASKVNHVANVDFARIRPGRRRDRLRLRRRRPQVLQQQRRRFYVRDQFAAINIKAGYQKLCGYRALDYVRFRHFDSDLYPRRASAGFLRQAKQQVGVTELFTSAKKLKKIIAENIRTDKGLANGENLQRFLTLAVKSAGKPVYQVQIPNLTTPTIGGASYVVVSNSSLEKAARTFLKGPKQKGDVAAETGSRPQQTSAPKKKKVRVAGLPRAR